MKKLKGIIGMMALLAALASCSSDNASGSASTDNTMKVSAKATYTRVAARSASQNTGVELTSFKINVREIEFKVADSTDEHGNHHHHHGHHQCGNGDNNDDGIYNAEDEIALSGPWELDLLNQTAPLTTVTIANGTYEEVTLKLSKSLVADAPLFNKTVKIEGTINGIPFVFWNDFAQKFEIDYDDPNQNLVVNNTSFDLVFNIDLNRVLSRVNLNDAIDGNANGVIEIGPDDTDGNNDLAERLGTHIRQSCGMHDHNHHQHN